MIPRILVPKDARPPARDEVSTRRRPTTLDERLLVPSGLPLVHLDGVSTIPANLPLDTIAARVVVPRDLNVAEVQRRDESTLPAQPTELDERITIPQGVVPPAEFSPLPPISEELVERDILQTGEVAFLSPEHTARKSFGERYTSITSVAMHILLLLTLIFEPKIFGPHVPSREQEEMARRQMTVLLPPGALDELKPSARPAPHASVSVDPRVIRKVAPTIEPPAPAVQPDPPKRELPSAPIPQPNAVAPPPTESAAKGDLPKSPVKLESPSMPVPQSGLVLPKTSSPGDTIRDAARQTARLNTPVAIGGSGQIPGGGHGGGGGGHGTAGAGIQMLTDTEGVDFNDYLRRVYITVKQNWFAVMPASVELGERGKVSLQFKIMRDGSVTSDDPHLVFGSGKEPLDRAAVSSIRASNPFPQLPPQFKGPFIELRFTYFYNLPID